MGSLAFLRLRFRALYFIFLILNSLLELFKVRNLLLSWIHPVALYDRVKRLGVPGDADQLRMQALTSGIKVPEKSVFGLESVFKAARLGD